MKKRSHSSRPVEQGVVGTPES